MKPRARLIHAIAAVGLFLGCSDDAHCPEHTTETYDLGTPGPGGSATDCVAACNARTSGFGTVESCRFVRVTDGGSSHLEVECSLAVACK